MAAVVDTLEFERLKAEVSRLRAAQRFAVALEGIDDLELKGDAAEALADARAQWSRSP